MSDNQSAVPRGAFQTLTLISAILFGLANFYDPAKDVYLRLQNPDLGSESTTVAFEQQKLTEKNLECLGTTAPRQLQLDNHIAVRLIACPSGDVLMTIYPANAPAKQRWVPSSPAMTAKAASLDWLIGMANAAETNGTAAPPAAPAPLAQMTIQNVCQAWSDPRRKSKLVRVTNENGTCFKQITNVYTGRVEVREKVACTTVCK